MQQAAGAAAGLTDVQHTRWPDHPLAVLQLEPWQALAPGRGEPWAAVTILPPASKLLPSMAIPPFQFDFYVCLHSLRTLF